MSRELAEYIPRIKELGLNEISDEQFTHIANVFGQDFLKPATETQKINAQNYLSGQAKLNFERKFAALTWSVFGKRLSEHLARRVNEIDVTGNGYYHINVGFDGHDTTVKKIQTMIPGADKMDQDLFYGASFSTEDKYVSDKILPGTLPKILRSGPDESPQFESIIKGDMFLIGLRGYTVREREANRVLYQLINHPELNNSGVVKEVLYKHPNIDKYVKPSILHPKACLQADLANHIVRMYLDTVYIEKASLKLDFQILTFSLFRRSKRAGRVILKA